MGKLPLRLIIIAVSLEFLCAGCIFQKPMPRDESGVAAEYQLKLERPPSTVTPQIVKISDEPHFIDEAQFLPSALRENASVVFDNADLGAIADWLRTHRKINVTLDAAGLAKSDFDLEDTFDTNIQDEPVYLLLNRLTFYDISWYLNENVVTLTTKPESDAHLQTMQLDVSEVLESGLNFNALIKTIIFTIQTTSWDVYGGPGHITSIEKSLLVSQTDPVLTEVRGLLIALEKPGRQTFVFEPAVHSEIRKKLKTIVSVKCYDKPLENVLSDISAQSGVSIHRDPQSIEDLSELENPVSISLSEIPASVALDLLLIPRDMSWILHDRMLMVTSRPEAETYLKTAVYDVRDFCAILKYADSFVDMITEIVDSRSWDENGGPGVIVLVKPGTLIVTQTEQVHARILKLLEELRAVLTSNNEWGRGRNGRSSANQNDAEESFWKKNTGPEGRDLNERIGS